jgi:hypothetical protein
VSALLDRLGLARRSIDLRLRGYSPSHDAIVEVVEPRSARLVFRPGRGIAHAAATSLLYLKVVRPAAAARLGQVHALLADRLATPPCVFDDADFGLFGFAPAKGGTLWAAIHSGAALPAPSQLVDALDRFRDVELGPSPRLPLMAAVQRNAAMLRTIAPERQDTIDVALDAIAGSQAQPLVTTHGDFHELQVLCGRGGVSALVDLGDAGDGERVDDLAMLAGRLWCFARAGQDRGRRMAAYAERLLEAFARDVDPEELRRRLIAVALNQATEPFRVQDPGWPRRTRDAIDLVLELITASP